MGTPLALLPGANLFIIFGQFIIFKSCGSLGGTRSTGMRDQQSAGVSRMRNEFPGAAALARKDLQREFWLQRKESGQC